MLFEAQWWWGLRWSVLFMMTEVYKVKAIFTLLLHEMTLSNMIAGIANKRKRTMY